MHDIHRGRLFDIVLAGRLHWSDPGFFFPSLQSSILPPEDHLCFLTKDEDSGLDDVSLSIIQRARVGLERRSPASIIRPPP